MSEGPIAIVSRVTRVLPGWDEMISRAADAGYPVHEEIGTGRTVADLPGEVAAELVGLVISAEPVAAAAFARMPRLRALSCIGSGIDHVDLGAAAAHGVTILRGVGGNAEAVADHTIAMLLGLVRGLRLAQEALHDGRGWTPWPPIVPRDLRSLTLGIIGLGNIGSAVARRGLALGMQEIVFNDPYVAEPPPGIEARKLELEELLEQADVVTLHTPLTDETRALIGVDEIARMRRDAVLLNLSRGGVLVEQAAFAALESSRLGGVGLDVLEREGPAAPPPPALPNLLVTPHMAGLSDRVARETRLAAIERLLDALAAAPAAA
jgi:phosphoglycerate dehydrogenase-like enzyme